LVLQEHGCIEGQSRTIWSNHNIHTTIGLIDLEYIYIAADERTLKGGKERGVGKLFGAFQAASDFVALGLFPTVVFMKSPGRIGHAWAILLRLIYAPTTSLSVLAHS
jgi:hypothetical protein